MDLFLHLPSQAHISDKYHMILWIREGLQSVALVFIGTRGLPQCCHLAMGRVSVAVSSFLRVKDTPIPHTHDVLEFWSYGHGRLSISLLFPELWAFSESPHEGTAYWSRMQPSHQPAAVPDRAPLPAMREHAAHIPVPTLLSHLKTNELSFFREGGGISVALDSLGVLCAVLCEHRCRHAPWAQLGDTLPKAAVASPLTTFCHHMCSSVLGASEEDGKALT